KRDAGKHQQAIAQIAEHDKQQEEDAQQYDRYDELQALSGRLQLLKSPAPGQPVARRQAHSLNTRLRVAHKRTDIAPTHIGADNDPALAVFAADLIGSGREV